MRHGDTIYWTPPDRRGPGAACAGPTYEARDDAGGLELRQGSQRLWVPIDFLRAVVADADARDAEHAKLARARMPVDTSWTDLDGKFHPTGCGCIRCNA